MIKSRTTVPPCVVETTIRKKGELGEDIEHSFPNEVPRKLRRQRNSEKGQRERPSPSLSFPLLCPLPGVCVKNREFHFFFFYIQKKEALALTHQILHHKGKNEIAQHPRKLSEALGGGTPRLLHGDGAHDDGVDERLRDHVHDEQQAHRGRRLLGHVRHVDPLRPRVLELVHHRRQHDVLVVVRAVKVVRVLVRWLRRFAAELGRERVDFPSVWGRFLCENLEIVACLFFFPLLLMAFSFFIARFPANSRKIGNEKKLT